ncbi:hypothetical protein Barb6_00088 [Bacteroidales bacterium Barb6]|nr:hypothetical protein Barb6_00088 [Bacteroidales bacterium Barb6]
MGNWDREQALRRERREREKVKKELLAKYLYDLSKLTFTALVLGGIIAFLQGSMEAQVFYTMIIFGSLVATICVLGANKLIK